MYLFSLALFTERILKSSFSRIAVFHLKVLVSYNGLAEYCCNLARPFVIECFRANNIAYGVARPIRAISTLISSILALIPFWKGIQRESKQLVAIFSNEIIRSVLIPQGIARLRRHCAKPSCSSMATSLFFSKPYSPSMPISATCCSTYWGMSSLRKSISTGKFLLLSSGHRGRPKI